MKRIVPSALLAAMALAAGCGGGTRVEVANDSTAPLTGVSLTISGIPFQWEEILPGHMVRERLTVPLTGRLVISYSSGGMSYTDTLEIPAGCDSASSVSVWITGEATSIKYSI